METRGRRVHAVEKAVTLLDCFWEAGRPLSLSELEQRTGWAKSTIHGLLASMTISGVVEQNITDGKYRLGYHLFELGSAVNQGWDVPAVCRPQLQALVDRFGESAYLARLSGEELILVECEEPHMGFRIVSEMGTRLPLHASSQGKAILAHLSPAEAERLLCRKPLRAFTEHTMVQPEALLAQLRQVRRLGYAEEVQEYRLGLRSVGAPIFSRGGACTYAVGIICMANVSNAVISELRQAVTEAAARISAELGYTKE